MTISGPKAKVTDKHLEKPMIKVFSLCILQSDMKTYQLYDLVYESGVIPSIVGRAPMCLAVPPLTKQGV